MRELAFRPRAAQDLESAVIYVGEVLGSPSAARKLYDQMLGACDRLCELPELGRRFEDGALEGLGYRSFLAGDYRVFYTFDDERLTVWRIVHTRRDIDDFALVDF